MKQSFFIILLYLLSCCFVSISAGLLAETNISDEDVALRSKYKEMDSKLKDLIGKGYKMILPHLIKGSEAMNLSTPCIANILSIGMGVRNLKLWAMNILDATGKANEGFFYGNLAMLGNFDQCLAAVSKNRKGEVQFRGKYCLISYNPYLPHPKGKETVNQVLKRTYANTENLSETLQYLIRLSQKGTLLTGNFYGFCIPSGCSLNDVQNMVTYAGDMFSMNLTTEYCQDESETAYLTTRKLIIICIFALFLLAGIISSVVEYYCKSRNIEYKGTAAEILRGFSITSNFPSFLSTKTDTEMLQCLNGIRVLSIFYIIYGHRLYAMQLFSLKSNMVQNIFDYVPTFFYQIVIHGGHITMEVFLFISGLLNMYMRMKLVKKGKTSRWWLIVIHRLWRIYPGYIATILLLYLFTPRGPLAPYYNEHFIDACGREWWKHFLFINNFYTKSQCLVHTWYLACDFQLFLMSLFTIPIVIKQPKRGILVNVAVIIVSLIFASAWNYANKVAPAFLLNVEQPGGQEDMNGAYRLPISHISSYFLGILLGYFLSVKKDIQIPKVYQFIGWVTASLTYTTMIFMSFRWNSGTIYSREGSALFYTFSKPMFAAAVGWMIFCCVTGHGGIINYILSLKLWIPLSKLTYSTYLVSLLLQVFYLANLRTSIDSHWMVEIWGYFGDLATSCLLALAIGIIMERPIFALEKLVFQRKNTEKGIRNLQHVTVNTLQLEESKNDSKERRNCVAVENINH